MTTQKQAFWFLIVGASAALIHFLALVICVQLFSISPIWSNVIAFLVAFTVSFIGHFSLTFNPSEGNNKQNKNWQTSLIKWFASSVAGFLLNQCLFIWGLRLIGDKWYAIIWFIVTALVTVITFALGKLWAFKH